MRRLRMEWLAAGVALSIGGAAQAIPMGGLELWLKADAGVTTSGSDVTAWQDQTGGTVYNLTPPTASKRPTLVSSWGYKNMPALSFDGVDDYVIDATNSMDLMSGLSIFIVAQNDVRKNYNGVFKLAQPATPENATADLEIYWQEGSTNAASGNAVYTVNRSTGTGAFGPLQGSNNPPAVGLPYILDVFAGGSLSQLRTNNVLAASTAAALLPGDATNSVAVGLGFNNNTIDGYIAEVLVYNRVLTSTERTEVYDYLSDRYIPEPASSALLAGGALLALRRSRG